MNLGIIVGIVGVFAAMFFYEYFFGPNEIDDRQGFPWSRGKRK
jgi:hypothetical protein